LLLELEERERRSGIVFLEHARTSTQDGRTLLSRRGNRRGGQPLVEMSTRERIGPLEGALGPSWSFRGDFLEMPEIGRCQGLRPVLRLLRIGTAALINAPAPRWQPPPWS